MLLGGMSFQLIPGESWDDLLERFFYTEPVMPPPPPQPISAARRQQIYDNANPNVNIGYPVLLPSGSGRHVGSTRPSQQSLDFSGITEFSQVNRNRASRVVVPATATPFTRQPTPATWHARFLNEANSTSESAALRFTHGGASSAFTLRSTLLNEANEERTRNSNAAAARFQHGGDSSAAVRNESAQQLSQGSSVSWNSEDELNFQMAEYGMDVGGFGAGQGAGYRGTPPRTPSPDASPELEMGHDS